MEWNNKKEKKSKKKKRRFSTKNKHSWKLFIISDQIIIQAMGILLNPCRGVARKFWQMGLRSGVSLVISPVASPCRAGLALITWLAQNRWSLLASLMLGSVKPNPGWLVYLLTNAAGYMEAWQGRVQKPGLVSLRAFQCYLPLAVGGAEK